MRRSLEVCLSRICCLLYEKSDSRDVVSSEDDDEDELDSRNCTIDDDHNESLVIHPRVVLPQSSTRKRLLDQVDESGISPPKRLRYDESRPMVLLRVVFHHVLICFISTDESSSATYYCANDFSVLHIIRKHHSTIYGVHRHPNDQ